MEVRLNKYISDSGFCSRREADRFIENGSVRINGRVAEMGMKVHSGDIIKVNGTLIEGDNETVYIALNKPIGVVSTTDPTERDNIVDFVNYPTRVFNIGRLDKESEGLILLTNDGDIVNKILRASNNHEKEYEVMVDKNINDEFVKAMAGGIPILGVMTKRCKVEPLGANRFRITLTQGLNRQIRRMCEHLGYEVTKLKRVRIMNITLDSLPLGQWRELTDSEVSTLNKSLESSKSTAKQSSTSSSRSTPSKKSTPSQRSKPAQKATLSKGKPQRATATKSRDERETRGRRGGVSKSSSIGSKRKTSSHRRG